MLDEIVNFDDTHHFMLGKSLAKTFPDNVKIRMSADMPRDNVLTDFLENSESLLVVSGRLKEFLEERKLKALEYLPVIILNHKGKPVKEPYFIANPFDHVDCLELKASQPRYSQVRKQSIDRIERFVLDPERIDPERELFKIKNLDGHTLVSRDLADAITKAKFTAIGWMKLEDYNPNA
jgi:hypothetical protein